MPLINVKIEEMSRQGMGVAKIDGFVILVNNTRPGDRVMIRITKVGSGFGTGRSFWSEYKERSSAGNRFKRNETRYVKTD